METHYRGVHLYCMKCDKSFYEKSDLTNHMLKVHEHTSKTQTCKFCYKVFQGRIHVHYRAVHFYCSEECDQQFETKEEILHHLESCHPDDKSIKHYMKKSYSCKLCDSTFRKSTDLYKSHYRYIHFFCYDCDIQLEDFEDIEDHLKKVHDESYKCAVCQKVYLENTRLDEHVQQRHTENPRPWRNRVVCDICDKSLSCNTALKHHKNVMHFNIKEPKDNKESFHCEVCPFSTKYKGNLEIHMKGHDQTLSQCDICHEKVKWLDRHIERRHTDQPRIKCNQCDYSALKDADMTAHIQRKHSLVKDIFKCDICDKELKGKSNLLYHKKLVHEMKDEDLYKCDICDHTCKTKQNIRNHKITHEDRKYSCDTCEYQCKSEKTLSEHKRTHLPIDQQLKCSECSFVTHLNRLLQAHQRKHLPEEEIKCSICSYVTPCKKQMKDHAMTYHKDVIPCQYCDFKAMSMQAHRQHITKTHSKTTCDYCDFTSTSISQARSHMKKCKNTDGRYICHVCEMQFSTSLARSQHQKEEHSAYDRNEKSKCDHCDFDSMSASNMKTHMKKCKETEGRYVCEDCGKQYSTLSARSKHVKNDH